MRKILIVLFLFALSTGLKSQNWTEQVSGTGNDLFSVFTYSSSVAWASGSDGTLIYTSNGGINWVSRSSTLFFNVDMMGIYATGNTTAYVVCNRQDTGKIFKTTNTGLTWTKIFARKGVRLNDIEFLNPAIGYVFGNPYQGKWFVIKTPDAGISFDTTSIIRPPTNLNNNGYRNSTCVFQANVNSPIQLYFGTNEGRIMRSMNGGITWDSVLTTFNDPVYAITFINATTGFTGGFDPFRTTNGGTNWTQQPYLNQGDFMSFAHTSGTTWYTTEDGICKSTNSGGSFSLEYSQPNNFSYNHMSFVTTPNDNSMTVVNGWAVTDNGGISHYGETIGITPIGTNIPKNYSLQQNYPNPFNPVTFIQFDMPKKDFVQLKVYDALGNLVKELFSGQLIAGSYKADFDASGYASGIYFYSITTSDFRETKRMVLIK
jgi:photosystem II stability/assembly factor-like uncharacterized protein